MKRSLFFLPAVICALICFQALLISVRDRPSWSQGLFYVCLPVCFLVLAGVLFHLSRELSRLRRRVGRLEGKVFADSRGQPLSHDGGHSPDAEPGSPLDGESGKPDQ